MTAPGANSTGVLITREVAAAFHVDRRTVFDWTRTGWLPYFRTPGGRHRYRRAEVEALLNGRQVTGGAR